MKNESIFNNTFAADYVANHKEMIEHWKQSTDVIKRGFATVLTNAAQGV